MNLHICVLSAIFASSIGLEKIPEIGSPCVTPNGENATCVSINSCNPIKQAIAYFDEDAIQFAKKSQCGYADSALVCCGSVGQATLPPDQTVRPTIPSLPFAPPPSLAIPIDNSYLPDSSLCGLQAKENRIVGGTVADIDEFPWMVALKYTKDDGTHGGFRCSGTLINRRYILTAAQCLAIPGFNLTEVRLGEWRLSTTKDCIQDTLDAEICTDPVKDLPIIEKIPHPYYNRKSGNNDIALLRVEEIINYTEFIRPICLPPSDFLPPAPGSPMEISGWGLTENGTQSDVKLKVTLPMVGNIECAKAYPNYSRINPNQACAGGEEGKDACSGDSGGPLMRTYEKREDDEEPQWFQEGIIYRGTGCGRKGFPGLYTRVSRYIHWILNNVKYS